MKNKNLIFGVNQFVVLACSESNLDLAEKRLIGFVEAGESIEPEVDKDKDKFDSADVMSKAVQEFNQIISHYGDINPAMKSQIRDFIKNTMNNDSIDDGKVSWRNFDDRDPKAEIENDDEFESMIDYFNNAALLILSGNTPDDKSINDVLNQRQDEENRRLALISKPNILSLLKDKINDIQFTAPLAVLYNKDNTQGKSKYREALLSNDVYWMEGEFEGNKIRFGISMKDGKLVGGDGKTKISPADKAGIEEYIKKQIERSKEEKHSIDVAEMNANDLLLALARDANMNIDILPGVEGKITGKWDDKTLSEILNDIKNQLNIDFYLGEGIIAVGPKGSLENYENSIKYKRTDDDEVYSITVTDMNAEDLLFALARDANMDIEILQLSLDGKRITMTAIDRSLPQILSRVCFQAGCDFDIRDRKIFITKKLDESEIKQMLTEGALKHEAIVKSANLEFDGISFPPFTEGSPDADKFTEAVIDTNKEYTFTLDGVEVKVKNTFKIIPFKYPMFIYDGEIYRIDSSSGAIVAEKWDYFNIDNDVISLNPNNEYVKQGIETRKTGVQGKFKEIFGDSFQYGESYNFEGLNFNAKLYDDIDFLKDNMAYAYATIYEGGEIGVGVGMESPHDIYFGPNEKGNYYETDNVAVLKEKIGKKKEAIKKQNGEFEKFNGSSKISDYITFLEGMTPKPDDLIKFLNDKKGEKGDATIDSITELDMSLNGYPDIKYFTIFSKAKNVELSGASGIIQQNAFLEATDIKLGGLDLTGTLKAGAFPRARIMDLYHSSVNIDGIPSKVIKIKVDNDFEDIDLGLGKKITKGKDGYADISSLNFEEKGQLAIVYGMLIKRPEKLEGDKLKTVEDFKNKTCSEYGTYLESGEGGPQLGAAHMLVSFLKGDRDGHGDKKVNTIEILSFKQDLNLDIRYFTVFEGVSEIILGEKKSGKLPNKAFQNAKIIYIDQSPLLTGNLILGDNVETLNVYNTQVNVSDLNKANLKYVMEYGFKGLEVDSSDKKSKVYLSANRDGMIDISKADKSKLEIKEGRLVLKAAAPVQAPAQIAVNAASNVSAPASAEELALKPYDNKNAIEKTFKSRIEVVKTKLEKNKEKNKDLISALETMIANPNNETVKAVQQILINKGKKVGGKNGELDGKFGDATMKALEEVLLVVKTEEKKSDGAGGEKPGEKKEEGAEVKNQRVQNGIKYIFSLDTIPNLNTISNGSFELSISNNEKIKFDANTNGSTPGICLLKNVKYGIDLSIDGNNDSVEIKVNGIKVNGAQAVRGAVEKIVGEKNQKEQKIKNCVKLAFTNEGVNNSDQISKMASGIERVLSDTSSKNKLNAIKIIKEECETGDMLGFYDGNSNTGRSKFTDNNSFDDLHQALFGEKPKDGVNGGLLNGVAHPQIEIRKIILRLKKEGMLN